MATREQFQTALEEHKALCDRLCAHCGRRSGTGFMLKNEVWRAAGLDDDQIVHLWCVEVLLGRSLDHDDFIADLPINQNVLWALRKKQR